MAETDRKILKEVKDVLRAIRTVKLIVKNARQDKEFTPDEKALIKQEFLALCKEIADLFRLAPDVVKDLKVLIDMIERVL